MNNTEYNSTETFSDISSHLLISSTLNTILGGLSLYLLIVLSYNFYKNKSKFSFCISPNKKVNYATISNVIFFVVNVLVLTRSLVAVSLFGFKYDFDNSPNLSEEERIYADMGCQAAIMFFNFAFIIGKDLIYFFLWIRQRIFYIHPEIKMFNNKCVRLISVGSIIGMLLWEAVMLICYFIFARYRFDSSTSLCTVVDSEVASWFLTVYILQVIKITVINLILLSLFIFPLKKYETLRKKNCINGLNSTSALHKAVKKVIFLSVIASISDILSVIVPLLLHHVALYTIFFAVSNISMLINLFAAIGCFDDWKSILCPCKFS